MGEIKIDGVLFKHSMSAPALKATRKTIEQARIGTKAIMRQLQKHRQQRYDRSEGARRRTKADCGLPKGTWESSHQLEASIDSSMIRSEEWYFSGG